MRSARRIGDLFIEIVAAVVLVTLYVVYLFHRPAGASLPWGWITLVINTLIVFGFLVAWFRRSWRNYLFWATVVLLLLCHLLVLSFFAGPHFLPTGFYAFLINPIELLVFAKILKRIPQDPPTRT